MAQSNHKKLIDIDFLPEKYREEFAQQKSQFWRIVGSVVFGIILLLTYGWQWNAQRQLTVTLEEITPIHEAAHGRTVKLTTLKNELKKLLARADLLIYLSHPWPKTQVLAAIIEPMPESIKLSELTISRAEEEAANVVLPSQRARTEQASKNSQQTGDAKSATEPDQLDLKDLRAEFDARPLVVQMAGETSNVSELHLYLGEVSQHPLIVKAELRAIESGGRDSDVTTFRARIFIKPGYGQPGGPTPQAANVQFPLSTKPDLHAINFSTDSERVN